MIVNIVLIVIIVLIALGGVRAFVKRAKGESCCGGGATDVKIEPADKDKNNYKYVAQVGLNGMHCKNCAAKIQNKLNSLDGTWAKVNFAKNSAEVLLKQNNQEEAIRKAVSDEGYSVTTYSESEKN